MPVGDLKPTRVGLRMYQVGFGDCFLLTFGYRESLADGRSERHVLIDFGSTRWPKSHDPRYAEIAEDIAARTRGSLDAVVLTHRHKDHLGGFADKRAGKTIAALKPALVLRPWTEDPAAPAGATGASKLGERSRTFAASLADAEAFAAETAKAFSRERRGVRHDIAEIALDQLSNRDAIERLDRMAEDARLGGRYLNTGAESGLERLLPGVRVSVLGPPTIEQWPAVAGERSDDPEYWLRHRRLLEGLLASAGSGARPVTGGRGRDARLDPGPTRWLVERMRDQHAHSLLRIVRTLDDALNNTSVILLFEANKRRLLFPGDAQIENWSYVLRDKKTAKLRSRLPQVDFYKVGHHGSRNATPRSLVAMWRGRRFSLSSAMSTLPCVHGESEATAVPRATLVDALGELGVLYRTDALPADQLFLDLRASTADRKAFTAVNR
jgi:hypothetical protein